MFNYSETKVFPQKRKIGFTLIEILVVIGIIVILITAILARYHKTGETLSLLRSAHRLAQDIRRAQETAMLTKEFQGTIPLGGYGIYFNLPADTVSYLLYADLDGNERYNNGDGQKEMLYFEKGIFIKEILSSSLAINSLSINFKPPSPTIKIIDTRTGENLIDVSIVLSLKSDPTTTKTVRINKIGLIEVK